MIGSPTLNKILEESFQEMSQSQKMIVFEHYLDLQRIEQEGSWLHPILYQNHWDYKKTVEVDGYCWGAIRPLIRDSKIFLRCFDLENFAFSDKQVLENTQNLSTYPNEFKPYVKSTPQDSDGSIKLLQDTWFKELIYNDETDQAKTLHQITVPKGTIFPLEIGFQNFAKTWHTLIQQGCLARVTYKTDLYKTPALWLLYYKDYKKNLKKIWDKAFTPIKQT